ncbi:MAG: hypothetical protein G3I08_09620 [Ferrovum sp.]|jgi:hypothetical protein|nr:hypothetical protein [Ferrovum sp.]
MQEPSWHNGKEITPHAAPQTIPMGESSEGNQDNHEQRPNVSFISWAAQYDVPLAKRMAAPYVVTNVNLMGRVPMADQAVLVAAQHFSVNANQYDRMQQLLSAWDLGLSGVDLQEITINNPQEPGQKMWIPFGKHKSHDKEFRRLKSKVVYGRSVA